MEKLGAPEFGLISQVLLAICFKSLGARIEALKQTGHPDIELNYRDRHWRVEVEFAHPNKLDFEVKKEDIDSTIPLSQLDFGYFGILDCNYPLNWKLIDTNTVRVEGVGFHSLSKLESLMDRSLSEQCTRWTEGFLPSHESEISAKRYPGMRDTYLLSC